MTRRWRELWVLGFALALAALFAGLWVRERASSAKQQDILVIDLSVARGAQVSMPYPIRVLDRHSKMLAGFDHHGIPQALSIPASRYPIRVVAGFNQCRSNKINAAATAVVEVGVKNRSCSAWQVE